jgi:hypothetical protein
MICAAVFPVCELSSRYALSHARTPFSLIAHARLLPQLYVSCLPFHLQGVRVDL